MPQEIAPSSVPFPFEEAMINDLRIGFGGALVFIAIRAAVQSAHELSTADDWFVFVGGCVAAQFAALFFLSGRE